MYHMNLVREGLADKFSNTSTTDATFLRTLHERLVEWKPPGPLEFPNKGTLAFQTVENEFATFDPGPSFSFEFGETGG